jgi:hypothetical protein
LSKNILKFKSGVRRKDNFLLTQTAHNARIKIILEFKIVGYSDETYSSLPQRGINPSQFIQHIIAVFLHKHVDFVQNNDDKHILVTGLFHKPAIHLIGWKASKRNLETNFLAKVSQDTVIGVDHSAIHIGRPQGRNSDLRSLHPIRKMLQNILGGGCLTSTSLAINEHIGRSCSSESGAQNHAQTSDVLLSVRKILRNIGGSQNVSISKDSWELQKSVEDSV